MGERILDGAEFFVRAAADVSIEDGLVVWRMVSGNFHFLLTADPEVLPEVIRRTIVVHNEHLRATGQPVLRLCTGRKKKRRKH